ncbi:MAG: InlB B-repeat-containing protein [Clostridia bacterium]|nr:InlB B-repeat-containing protein [Clostridia bacterium]
MKKNLFKKSMSVFLSVLMLMSCWVFFPGMVTFEAGAAATDTTYRENADQYGTPYWTATDDNTHWMLWGESRDASKAHVWIKVPRTIYLDKSETLQSAGYKIEVEWSLGDGTSYRWGLGPAAWGYGTGISGQSGTEQFTMTNMFKDYSSNSSMNGENEYGVNGYNDANKYDLRVHDNFDGSSGFIVYKNTGGTSNRTNYIYLIGTPNTVGSGRYSTTGINPSPFNFTQQWTWKQKWETKTSPLNATGKPSSVEEQLYGYNEVWWDIEIYDKASLKTAVDYANTVYDNNISYSSYVLNNGLENLKQLANEGYDMLDVRELASQSVTDKTTAINNAAKTVQFQAKNTDLINKVAEARALQAKAGYNTLYTQASRQNLQAVIENVTANTLYKGTTVYSTGNYTDAGARAAAEQTEINNLINSITVALNGLVRRYDVGYDNLFSFTDWALNPVKENMSNGTIEIDADNGTIKITHDGSADGTDNNTSQQPTYYRAKVEGNTEYVLTWNTAGSGRGQIHVFYTTGDQYTYNVNNSYNSGSHWFVSNGDLPYSEEMGKHEVAFTTLPETDGLVFRFGTCNAGDSITFSNIRLVKKSDYDAYASKYTTTREAFEVGDTKELTYAPTREGYVFDGWYTADGVKVTNISGFTASDIVYAHWIQKFAVTFKNQDGTVIETQYVAPGEAAVAPSTAAIDPDENYEYVFAGWDKDFSNVTSDLVVTAQFTQQAHSGIKYQRVSAATCTTPGKITKLCTACNYKWNNGEAFEDTAGEFAPALGHTYDRAEPTGTVVTDKGTETGHTVKCNACDATTTKAHDYKLDANHPASDATCIKEGETYYKCACLREKTETGSTNPNNHVNTELRDVEAAKCGVEGYTGDTWCKDCGSKIATGSATPALEHSFTTYVDQNDATCDKEGTEIATCDRDGCNVTDSRSTGKKREHSFTNYVDQGDATCDKEGTEIATCDYDDCNATDSRSTGKKREHKFDGTVKDNGNGTHSFECSYDDCDVYGGTVDCSSWKENATEGKCECDVCGYTKVHTWSDWSQAEGNTADAAGKMVRSCGVCGAEETTDCTYTFVKTPATCEDDAYTTYTCTDANCGHGYVVVEIGSATGHKFNGDYNYDSQNDKHQQKCEKCDAYGVGTAKDAWADCSWTYNNAGEGKHTASCVCGNSEAQDCSGGTATCTAKAVCQYCGEAYGEKAPHSYTGNTYFDGVEKAKDATCTAQAEYYTYCSACKASSKGTDKEATFAYGDLLPHTYTGNTEYLYKATDAECEVNETYYVYCSECKASSEGTAEEATFEKADTALEHVWVEPQYNGEETLKHTFTCERGCGETMTANCADSAIVFGFEPATCTSQGYDIVQCSACNHTWNINYTDALGHDYTKKIYTGDYLKAAVNCEHANEYWYACSRCGRSAEDITDDEVYTGAGSLSYFSGEVRNHDFQNKVDAKYLAEPATCFAAAKYFTSCKYEDCGKSSEEVYGVGKGTKFSSGTALAHDWTEVEAEKYLATPADCANDATYYYECSLCKNSSKDYGDGATWTDVDSKSGHSMAYTAAKAADCYEAGNLEYWYCDTCKKYYKDVDGTEAYLGQSETVVKKREHDLATFSFKAATCEEDGHPAYVKCKYDDCDYTTLPAELPNGYKATGHNFTGAYYCDTAHNYHAKYCANDNCDMVTLTDAEGNPYQVKTFGMVIDGKQVKYNVEYTGLDYVITGGEECSFTYTESTVDGVHSHANACVCGNSTAKTYSDEETFVETVAPTCTTDGYDSYACPDCGTTWTKNVVARNGHTPAANPTTNGDGTHSIYCTVEGCGYRISTEKCSGGTATCSKKAECTVCGAEYGDFGTHVYATEWVYQNDAACGKNGTEKNTCTACNTEQTREAEGTALKHSYSDYVYALPEGVTIPGFDTATLKEPTCGTEGRAISYCTLCNDVYKTKIVPADSSAHAWEVDENGELVWTAAGGNCATGVTMVNRCTVCDKTQSKVVNDDHQWEIYARVEANCKEDGYIVFKCANCSFTLLFDKSYEGYPVFEGKDYELTEKLGHSWEREGSTDELIVDKEATCAIEGRGYYVCADCQDKSDSIAIEKLEHNLVEIAEQKVTCTIDGYKAYVKCIACSYDQHLDEEWLAVEGNYTPATGHIDDNNDGKCDGCKKQMEGDEAADNCNCICHKDGWFSQIIYKILRFFWKLFKIGKSCDCGTVHY